MISDTESEGGEIVDVFDPEIDSAARRDSDQYLVRRLIRRREPAEPAEPVEPAEPAETAEPAEPAEPSGAEVGAMRTRVHQPHPDPNQEEQLDEPVIGQEEQDQAPQPEGDGDAFPMVPGIQAVILDLPPVASPPTTSRRSRGQESVVISLDTPSPPKKRKRGSPASGSSSKKSSPEAKLACLDEDEDDGMTCPICLESWEMSGEHRLVSLRCGHLYGESCIRRWLNESQRQSSVKVCPQCKTKASYRDIRKLYAKKIQMLDTAIKEQLEAERRRNQELTTELATSKLCHALASEKLVVLQANYDRLKELVRAGGSRGAFAEDASGSCGQKSIQQLAYHRLYMEKNFEITREAGCRVLLFSAKHSMLVASQKSAQNLFPGYGMRFIDPISFKPLHFLHTSAMMIRDVAFSESQHLLTVASREPKIKLFDIRSRLCSSMFTAHDKLLWSCALDRNEREHFLYAGDLRGGVYIYDLRFPENILCEFPANDNFSPVIHIVTVPPNKTFISGGFLVCQLTALTFYEYTAANDTAVPTRLNVEGPFLSMQYDAVQDTLLISVRSNPKIPHSRFILGQLDKIDDTPVLKIKATIYGSKFTPIMTRPTQLGVEDNTLVLGYLQDKKVLMMHDVRREERIQTMPVNEVIYDICPVATQAGSYLAALTDNKCRVYKLR